MPKVERWQRARGPWAENNLSQTHQDVAFYEYESWWLGGWKLLALAFGVPSSSAPVPTPAACRIGQFLWLTYPATLQFPPLCRWHPLHLQPDVTTSELQNLIQLSLPVSTVKSHTLRLVLLRAPYSLLPNTANVCVCVCLLPVSFMRAQNTSVFVVTPHLMPSSTSGIYHKVSKYL